jgi:hypothetical protein
MSFTSAAKDESFLNRPILYNTISPSTAKNELQKLLAKQGIAYKGITDKAPNMTGIIKASTPDQRPRSCTENLAHSSAIQVKFSPVQAIHCSQNSSPG